MSQRTRLTLLVLVVLALVASRASGALAAPTAYDRDDAQLVDGSQIRFIAYARLLLGVPYTYGGTTPASGFDCSGFTRYVYAHFGYDLPHYSGGQFAAGHAVDRGGLAPGDLVFFDSLGHVGIYVGDDEFIHAPHTGRDVAIDSLSGWYGSRFVGARRLL
jgi:peptidoglycan DL-endopeptidase CwlO